MLEQKTTFSEDMCKFYAVQMIDAIKWLLQNDIAHRDLKLENVLIDENGYLVIIDFGIAKKIQGNDITQTVCGTLGYMAPEIMNG